MPEQQDDPIVEDCLDEDNGGEEGFDMQLNIQTRPTEIENPSNLAIQIPKLPLSTPETTKVG